MKRSVVLGLIFFIAVFLRFYKLETIPNGLQQDETSIGYNAYSILTTGKDEYGIRMPLYFKAFGEYKLPGYIYGSVIPIQIFGTTPLGVRFLSAFTGSFTILVIYWLVLALFGETKGGRDNHDGRVALLAAALLAINPWHLHFSRGAFEVTPALFFLGLGIVLFLHGVQRGKNAFVLLGVFSLILSVYTYNITRLLAPVLLVYLFLTHATALRTRKAFLPTIGACAIGLLPFILSVSSSGGASAARGTIIFSSAVVQASLLEFRSYMIALPSLVTKLFFNSWNLTLWHYIQNIARYISIDFFFISGSPHGNHGIGTSGQFYLFDLPLIIAGIVSLFRTKKTQARFLLTWICATVAIASLTREAPHATRSFFLILPLVICSAWGLLWCADRVRAYGRIARLMATGGFVMFALFNTTWYVSSYYIRFPVAYAKAWRSADDDVTQFIASNYASYDTILIEREMGFIYSSYLFYSGYPPDNFYTTVHRTPDDSEGFSRVESFGKIHIRTIDWAQDIQKPGTLIITNAERVPSTLTADKTFYYPRRPVVFAVGQEIVQYPVEEIAYVAIEIP